MNRLRFYNIPFIGFMIVLFFAPILQMKLGLFPERVIYEKRDLEPKPNVQDVVDAKLFLQKFESYFNDHFGFRSHLIELSAYLHLHILKNTISPKVILGKDGFLFYNHSANDNKMVNYTGVELFNAEEIEDIRIKWQGLKAEMDKRKIHVLVVMAPLKQTIYPEKLPAHYLRQQGRDTQADQIAKILPEIGVDVVDLRGPLRKIRESTNIPLYHRTDSHWTALGAFWGGNVIGREIAKIFPHYDIRDISDYTVKFLPALGNGDLANMSNLEGRLPDYTIEMGGVAARAVRQEWNYDKMTRVYEVDDKTLPKLVVFHDSFFLALIPFIRDNFSRSMFRWQHYLNFDIIDKEKPDLVIFEFVEMYASVVLNPLTKDQTVQ